MLYPLSKMIPRQTAVVNWLSDHKSISKRLADLGFEPGSPVTCVLSKSKGELSAFLIRGAVIALRREDAELVLVRDEAADEKAAFETSAGEAALGEAQDDSCLELPDSTLKDESTKDNQSNDIESESKTDSTGGTKP